MIKVQNEIIDVKRFPDGTQMLLDFDADVLYRPSPIKIVWCYESDDEALTLMYLKRHIDNNYFPINSSPTFGWINSINFLELQTKKLPNRTIVGIT